LSEEIVTLEGESATLAAGRREMIDDDLAVHAVLADPDGERFVEAPRSHDRMTDLQRDAHTAREGFYCATQLGGCGGEIHPVNGLQKRPFFRHNPGSNCTLTAADTRDTYTHRAIQTALVAWLHDLGHEARLEKPIPPHSRVDVHCHPDAVIEVQLSGETALSMQDRTERYGRNVTWLFDPDRPITSRDTALATDETVLLVRLRPHSDEEATTWPRQVDIGIGIQVADVPGNPHTTLWAHLETCTFTPTDGLCHPGRGEADQWITTAKETHQQAVAAQQEAERKIAEEQAAFEARLSADAQERALERYRQQSRQLAKRRAEVERTQKEAEAVDRPDVQTVPPSAVKNGPAERRSLYPVVWSLADLAGWEERNHMRVPEDGAWVRVLRHHHDLFPDWAYQLRDQWAVGLPDELIDPAWATLYLLATSLSGQVPVFIDAEVDRDGTILRLLAKRGLISLYGEPPGPLMLRLNQRVIPDPARPKQHPVWNAY
jgi:hypothetical protein